jgi:hypothetical protein
MELNLVIVSGFVSTMIFLSTRDLLSGLSICETSFHFTLKIMSENVVQKFENLNLLITSTSIYGLLLLSTYCKIE